MVDLPTGYFPILVFSGGSAFTLALISALPKVPQPQLDELKASLITSTDKKLLDIVIKQGEVKAGQAELKAGQEELKVELLHAIEAASEKQGKRLREQIEGVEKHLQKDIDQQFKFVRRWVDERLAQRENERRVSGEQQQSGEPEPDNMPDRPTPC
jgi:flagellar biosynthesis component FlhA